MFNRHLFLLSRGLNGRYKPPQAPPKEGMSAAPVSAFLYPSPFVFCGATSLGSVDSITVTLPASPTTQDETGVWKGFRLIRQRGGGLNWCARAPLLVISVSLYYKVVHLYLLLLFRCIMRLEASPFHNPVSSRVAGDAGRATTIESTDPSGVALH